MIYIEFIKDNWQGFVPIFVFLLALFIYVAHDRKLKKLQIKKLKDDQEEKKKANIKCNAYRHKANCIVKIVNAGPANAFNVKVEIQDKDKLEGLCFYHNEWGPYDLINATNSVEERIALCCGHTEHLTLKIIWDDDYSKNRVAILNVQL